MKGTYFNEAYYKIGGIEYRIIFGVDDQALSILVGLSDHEKNVTITGPGNWPIDWSSGGERNWATLKFSDFGNAECEQLVQNGASASLNSVTCGFTFRKPGSSAYSNDYCYISAGYSDGAIGVYLTENPPDISEYDLKDTTFYEYENENVPFNIKELIWRKTSESTPNYFMVSCDKDFIVDGWE